MYIINCIPALLALITCFTGIGASLPQDLSPNSLASAHLHRRTPMMARIGQAAKRGGSEIAKEGRRVFKPPTNVPKPDPKSDKAAKNTIDTLNTGKSLLDGVPKDQPKASRMPSTRPNIPNTIDAGRMRDAFNKK
ncbi:hypothetical protein H4R33_000374 [Dimargaris cristalligena]|nr:hypothetical protein H4R33_000374 [Dimargaris cristalligena]